MSPIDLTGGANAVPADQDGQMIRPGGDESVIEELAAAIEGDEPEEAIEEAEPETEEAEVEETVEEESDDEPDYEYDRKMEELSAREAELNRRNDSYETERRIKNLLRYPGFRERVQALLGEAQDSEFEWGRKDNSDDGVRSMLKGFKDDRLDEIMPAINRMTEKLAQIEQVEERTALNAMRDDFKSTFGDVVTDEEWSKVERDTLKVYGQRISREAVELMAFKRFSKNGVRAQANSATEKVKNALAAQPKGTRIVNAATTAKQAKPKLPDPRKMSDADVIRELADGIYS